MCWPPGHRMRIQCRLVLEDIKEGASIAVNGVCLTAVESFRPRWILVRSFA